MRNTTETSDCTCTNEDVDGGFHRTLVRDRDEAKRNRDP